MMKTYPIEVVLSLSTGYLLRDGGFGDMHELAEHVLGHPVWTHEFADKGTIERMKEAVFAQHPQLREAEAFDRAAAKESIGAYLTGYIERAAAKFGATLEFEEGAQKRTESPLESAARLMPGKPVIGVVEDD